MKNTIKRLLGFKNFRYNTVVVFHMKSGSTLRVPCDNFTFEHNDNGLVSYKLTGGMTGALLYVNLREVESLTQETYNRFTNYLK